MNTDPMPSPPTYDDVAVLLGGGIESTALVDRYLASRCRVTPVHISCGLRWDDAELGFVRRFVASRRNGNLNALIEIRISLDGFLNGHWASNGNGEAAPCGSPLSLEIPHRNLLLLGLSVHRLPRWPVLPVVIGTTADNNFSDGSRQYFDRCAELLSLEMQRPVEILTPFIGLTKTEVIQLSSPDCRAMSFSCVSPVDGEHCGRCLKCVKKKAAFLEAQVADPTRYVAE